jgi:hypothetical protein
MGPLSSCAINSDTAADLCTIGTRLRLAAQEGSGETVILSDKWKLLNGQHRLNACILSKKPFPALIVQGLPERVYRKLDSGEKRRAADWLAHEKEVNTKVLAAAIKTIWTWEQGTLCSNKRYPSNQELERTLQSHPGIRDFNTSTFAKSVKGLPGSLTLALRYIFGQFDKGKPAAEFFDKLASGEGLKKGSPILLLRDKLADDKRSQAEAAAIVIKAYDLRFRSSGKNREDMPKIVGVEAKESTSRAATDVQAASSPQSEPGAHTPSDMHAHPGTAPYDCSEHVL